MFNEIEVEEEEEDEDEDFEIGPSIAPQNQQIN